MLWRVCDSIAPSADVLSYLLINVICRHSVRLCMFSWIMSDLSISIFGSAHAPGGVYGLSVFCTISYAYCFKKFFNKFFLVISFVLYVELS